MEPFTFPLNASSFQIALYWGNENVENLQLRDSGHIPQMAQLERCGSFSKSRALVLKYWLLPSQKPAHELLKKGLLKWTDRSYVAHFRKLQHVLHINTIPSDGSLYLIMFETYATSQSILLPRYWIEPQSGG